MKSRIGGTFATVILIAIVIFLAVDVSFSLYHPDRLASTLPVCILNIISGSIQVQTKDTITWEKAEDGMILEPGSRVKTAPDSHASLTFSQGTTTKLEPGTDLIVANLEGSQDTQPDIVVLEQRAGKTLNQVAARPVDDYHFQIRTSSADVRVHGTLFSTEVDETGTTLIQTTEGQVDVSAQGQEVPVSAGQQTEVEPGAAPSAPVPIPPATNELVFTISEPAIGLVIDPSGSSTGHLPDGSPLNQISGSRLSPSEEANQVIRICEPKAGEYAVVMHGAADGCGSFSIKGFAEGNSTFIHNGTCNITEANDLVLNLHLDVLDGLLQGATLLGLESSENQLIMCQTTIKTAPPEIVSTTLSPESPDSDKEKSALKKEDASEQKSNWLRPEGDNQYYQRVFITSIVIILAVIFAIVWRKH